MRLCPPPCKCALLAMSAAPLLLAQPAQADEGFELWLGPSVTKKLDKNASIELETAQKFKSKADKRYDLYYFRGWVRQKAAKGLTLSIAAEKRIADGSKDETRFTQEIDVQDGYFTGRLQLEERFFEKSDGRMGLRVRPRAGVISKLDKKGKWTFDATQELFLTVRAYKAGGDTGVTGLRSRIGITSKVSKNLKLSLHYIRDETFKDKKADKVAHAPKVGVKLKF